MSQEVSEMTIQEIGKLILEYRAEETKIRKVILDRKEDYECKKLNLSLEFVTDNINNLKQEIEFRRGIGSGKTETSRI